MAFIAVGDNKGLYERLTMLLYSAPRLGKTTALLQIPATGEILYVLSTDAGLRAALSGTAEEVTRINKNMRVTYATGLLDIRRDLSYLSQQIPVLISKGVKPWKIWVALDTVTHLQQHFLSETRTIQVGTKGATGNPQVGETYVRDATVQVDYGILNAWMNEIVNGIMRLPCNVVFIALEKSDDKKKTMYPALVGQSADKVAGDVDVIAYLIDNGKGGRELKLKTDPRWLCGFRGKPGLLADTEGPDLLALRDKYLRIGG